MPNTILIKYLLKKVLFLMHKIEWNELWSKVVECYFKKLLLDNLFHNHLSLIHVGNLLFYFLLFFVVK